MYIVLSTKWRTPLRERNYHGMPENRKVQAILLSDAVPGAFGSSEKRIETRHII